MTPGRPRNPNPDKQNLKKAAFDLMKLAEAKIQMLTEAMAKLPFSESEKKHAVMIERAIRELNNEEGSSEESISNFIRKEYNDLPFAHLTLLHHHLKQLCENGCIILTKSLHYLLADTDSTFPFGKNIKRMNSRTKQDLLKLFKEHQQWLEPQLRKDTTSREDAEQTDEDGDDDDDDDDPTELQDPDLTPGFETLISKETSNFLVSCTKKLLEMKSEVARNKPSSSKEQHSPLADSSSPTTSSLLQQFQAHKFSKHGDSDFEELHMKQPWMIPYFHEQQLLNLKVSQPEQHQTPVNPSRFATKQAVLDNKTGAQKTVPLPPSSDQQEFSKQPWMNLKVSQPEHHQTPLNLSRLATKQAVLDNKTGPQKTVPLPPSEQEFSKQPPWMTPHWHLQQLLNLKVSQPDQQHQTPVNSSQFSTSKQAVLDKGSTRVTLPSSSDQQEFNKSTLQMHPTHPPWKKVTQNYHRVVPPPRVQQQQWKQKEKPGSEMMIIKEDSIPSTSHPGGQFDEEHGSTGEERKSGSAAGGIQQYTEAWKIPEEGISEENQGRCLSWQ